MAKRTVMASPRVKGRCQHCPLPEFLHSALEVPTAQPYRHKWSSLPVWASWAWEEITDQIWVEHPALLPVAPTSAHNPSCISGRYREHSTTSWSIVEREQQSLPTSRRMRLSCFQQRGNKWTPLLWLSCIVKATSIFIHKQMYSVCLCVLCAYENTLVDNVADVLKPLSLVSLVWNLSAELLDLWGHF